MSKQTKKRDKILERIKTLEDEIKISLTKKSSSVKEINVSEKLRKIQDLKTELLKTI